MKFGILFANTGPFSEPEGAVTLGRAAEAAGFDSIWTVEHVIIPDEFSSAYPYSPDGKLPGGNDMSIPDPLIWLAHVGARTTTIKLATGVLILPQRNPVVLAKELATLDRLTGGRVVLGIGVGWLAEEFDALGVPFAERAARTDDAVGALRALWGQDRATYAGEFSSFTASIMRPQPAAGTIPVHVGGHSPAAARRAGRLGDGFFPAKGDHAQLAALFDTVRRTAEEHGRDPDAIELTAGGRVIGDRALDEIERLGALGVDRVIVPAFAFFRDPEADIAAYGERVIAAAG